MTFIHITAYPHTSDISEKTLLNVYESKWLSKLINEMFKVGAKVYQLSTRDIPSWK